MLIKDFYKKYKAFATEKLKEQFFKTELHIKTYIPFLTKTVLADKIIKSTILDKDTGKICMKSDMNYLLFCRTIIEEYTDLEIETEDFYDEYDLLNESGILDKIIQMIPEKEISEFKTICDMKKDDLIFNMGIAK